MKYYLDGSMILNGKLLASGWAVPENSLDTMRIKVTTLDQAEADVIIKYSDRGDVATTVVGNTDNISYGFSVEADYSKYPALLIRFYSQENPEDNEVIELSSKTIGKKNLLAKPQKAFAMAKKLMKTEHKGAYIKSLGFVQNAYYRRWLIKNKPSVSELKKQANTEFSYMPLISLVVPVYLPQAKHLKSMVRSVMNQSYQNWQLCLANGSGEDADTCRLVNSLCNSDTRIKSARLKVNRGISGNTNVGIQMADGEWIAFADQDDVLSPNAFYEYVKAINEDPDIDALYCDEDKIDDETGKHFQPHFKSDFNKDLLLCNNYICHMFMVRQSVIDEVGMLRRAYDGAQDHDFILRCSAACKKVAHVSKMLYSWRSHAASTASCAQAKDYAYDAGAAAVDDYYRSHGMSYAHASRGPYPGLYRTDFLLDYEPLISVIIPNKDHIDDLEKCLTSIREKITYKNYEIIIVENNSENEDTFIAYKRLERSDSRIRAITYKGEFNYSAINNFAVREAKGDYLLLLNNDTEVISPDLFTSMAGYLKRPEVGVVGAKLLYADNTVQHAGLLVGVDHAAHHVYLNFSSEDPGYMGRAIVSQDMSGVTAACMLVKKDVYEKVGGFDESFTIAYNDVDFCLKVQKAGYLCVFDAFIRMYHFESKSRGGEDSMEQKERFENEKSLLLEKWGDRMNSDPYYNINLGLKNGYYNVV